MKRVLAAILLLVATAVAQLSLSGNVSLSGNATVSTAASSAGINKVGTAATGNGINNATMTLTKTLSSGNQAIVGFGWSDSSIALTSVVGSVNGAYSLINCFSESFGATSRICLYHHDNVSAGSETVTVTMASAPTGAFFGVLAEFSGIATTSSIDNAGAGSQINGVTNPSTTATGAATGELLIGFIAGNAAASAGAGFTDVVAGSTGDTYGYYDMQFLVTSGTGTQTSTWSTGTNYYWMLAATLKHQ